MIDLAIIGGGPAGYVAAERAGAKGLSVTLFEKRELGGVCLNEGCIPTKTLLYSAKVFNYAQHGDVYGVNVKGAECDFAKVVARKDKVVKKLVGGVGAAMRANKVTVVKGEAVIEGRSAEGITIVCNGEKYLAANLLICSGSEAAVPPIPGLKEAGDVIVTNREILALKEQPKELVVIGGGVIGMEFAAFFNTIGTKVTVVEMLPKILGPLDDEISSSLQKIYAKRGIEFCLSCKVTAIEGNTVVYETPDGKVNRVSGDKILVSVGRRANIKGIGLENIGVEAERGIKVDDKMRTNIPNVFAAGDCVSGYPMLAHVANRQGEIVVNNLTGGNDRMRTDAIPSVVYTNPEVASVGLTEAQAKAAGKEFKIINLPMAYAGRFVAENEGGEGFCKILVGAKHGEILGVHMMGNPSSEMLYGCCMAIEMEMTVEELKQIIYPHPTVSEIIKEAVFSVK
ncbi:MAG: dihydrolipoyl dehydrogenase [Bacteroidales bacterium]|nr:dihydrolipoyl dehydrogenase [Bacteroidales bacterium]